MKKINNKLGMKNIAAIALALTMSLQAPAAVFASEEASEPAIETQAPEPETQPPAPETQAPEPETQAPEPETQAPEPETQASETESQGTETESSESESGQSETNESEENSETMMESQETLQASESQTDSESMTESVTESLSETGVETAWSDILSDDDVAAVIDLLRSDTAIPVDGLPAFLTQEMVSGALKVQDEKGYPASVVIAQIIVESGNGAYGSRGEDYEGLTKLAFQYHNLFALKGTGTVGTVYVSPEELKHTSPLGAADYYFRSYNTDMESIDDWASFVAENYDASLKKARNSEEFADALAAVWSTDRSYALDLRKAMADYDLARLDKLTLAQFEDMLSDYVNPCPGSHITSGFGYRLWDHKVHLGLDLATGSIKIPTYAADSGTVVSAAFGHSVGNMIVIDNGNGIVTKYMHHSKMYVKPGDYVVKGQQIGLAGTTGHSTGIHLHFQIEVNGQPVNPLPYLKSTASKAIPVKEEESKPLIESPSLDLLTGFGEMNLAVYNSVKLDAGDQS